MPSDSDRQADKETAADELLAAQYNAMATERVPARLNRKILSLAEAELAGNRGEGIWSRWNRPLLLAAAIGIGIAVTLNFTEDPVAPPTPYKNGGAVSLSPAIKRGSIIDRRPSPPSRLCSAEVISVGAQWWLCIEELRKLGNHAAANSEQSLFDKAYPGYVPPEA